MTTRKRLFFIIFHNRKKKNHIPSIQHLEIRGTLRGFKEDKAENRRQVP